MFKIKLTKDNKDKIPIISKEMIEQSKRVLSKYNFVEETTTSEIGNIIELREELKYNGGTLAFGTVGRIISASESDVVVDFLACKGHVRILFPKYDQYILRKCDNQFEMKKSFEKANKEFKGESMEMTKREEWISTIDKRANEIDEALSKIEKRNDFIDAKEFEEIVKEQLETCKKVLCDKAKEYATEDRLHNFKVASKLENCTPVGALGGMMAKHTVSVYDMIDGTNKGIKYPMELWNEKITDSMNYLLLLKALVVENNRTE